MGKHPVWIGAGAAALGCAAAQGLWALGGAPHAWAALLFALFPVPVVVETARLIALYALFGAAGAGRGGLRFAGGFALIDSMFAAATRIGAGGAPDALLAAALCSAFAQHFFLGLAGVAIKALNAPPMAIFCVLAIIHGAHNGAMIAAEREFAPLTALAAHGLAIAGYGALAFWLARGRMRKVAQAEEPR